MDLEARISFEFEIEAARRKDDNYLIYLKRTNDFGFNAGLLSVLTNDDLEIIQGPRLVVPIHEIELFQMQKLIRNERLLIITGCYPEGYPGEIITKDGYVQIYDENKGWI
jgi:hypothetical protein